MSSLADAVESLSIEAPNSPLKHQSSISSSDSSVSTSSNTSSSSSRTETPPPPTAPWSNPLPNSLETHIKKAYYNQTHQNLRRPFFHQPPLLQKNLPNRILLYYGGFNPPHIAHLNLLRHIYTETCSEYNVIAALILPRADEYCSSKFADRADTTHSFSLKERIEMWEQDFELPDWACVIDANVVDTDTDSFRWELRGSAREAGFEIKCVSVIGPDYANAEDGVYNYGEEVMFSDTGRSTDFIAKDRLLTLPGCTPWEELQPRIVSRICPVRRRELHTDESQEYVRGYLSAGQADGEEPGSQDGFRGFAAGQAYLEGLQTAREGLPAPTQKWKKCKEYAKGYTDGLKTLHVDNDQGDDQNSEQASKIDSESQSPTKFNPNAIYTCRRTDKTDNVIFIPTAEDYRKYISSTDIRKMMSKNKSNPKEITTKMASLVLGPHRKPQKVVPKPQRRAERIRNSLYKSSIFS